jgi:hypothetical protein
MLQSWKLGSGRPNPGGEILLQWQSNDNNAGDNAGRFQAENLV